MIEEISAVKEIVKANATVVYSDAAQPSVRVVGKSLAQCTSLFTTPVGRIAEIFEKNIHRYLDKLEGIKEEDLVAPDTRVLVPVLEKLRFTDEEKVADYYAEILATASKKEHASKVMITFIEILNRLTADEILILEHIISGNNNVSLPGLTEEETSKYGLPKGTEFVNISGSFPVVDVKRVKKSTSGYSIINKNFNLLTDVIVLKAPENIDSYVDNMTSLGLLERSYSFVYVIDKIYESLEKSSRCAVIKREIELDDTYKANFTRGRIDITDLGKKLLSLCARDTIDTESKK